MTRVATARTRTTVLGRRCAAHLAVLAIVLSGCGSDQPSEDGASESVSAESSEPTTATTSAAPFVLPDNCNALLSLPAIDAATGVRISGSTNFIEGEPEPGIERTGRVTCQYGVLPGPDGAPGAAQVEASVFTYASAEAAQSRVDTVVEQARSAGELTTDAAVEQLSGFIVTSVADATLVVATEDRNYAITLLAGVVPDDRLNDALIGLAQAAVNGGAVPEQTPAPSGSTSPSPTSSGPSPTG